MNILGEAYVRIKSLGDTFAADTEAAVQPGLTAVEDAAGSSGLIAGENLRGGVKDGLSDVEKDAAESGERAGAGLSSGMSKGLGGLSSLLGAVGIPMGDLSAKTEELSGKLEGAGESGGGFASSLGKIPIPMVAVGAAVLGVLGVATDLGLKFQDTTAKIAASAGISQKAAADIGQAFLSTAGSTTFSGQQIAQAYVGVAGQLGTINGKALDAKQALDVMRASMDLAEASGTSLSSAAATVAATLQAFQLPVSQASTVTDVLWTAATKTGVSVDSMGNSLDKARAKMGATAPSIQDLAGFMLDLTEHGETGRAAMTALGSAFTGIISPTAAVTAAQQQMGVSFLNAKTGGLDPLSQIIGELAPKLAGMSGAQATAELTTLGFGSASAKLATTIQAGVPAFAAATDAVSKHGTASLAAAKATDTFSGSWEKVKSGVEDALTELGTKLAPVLTAVGADVAKFIQMIVKDWPEISAVIGDVFKLVKPILEGFVTMVKGMLEEFSGIIEFLKGIFTGHWSEAWDGIRKIFDGFIETIKGKVMMFLGPLIGVFRDAWTAITSGISTAWNAIVNFFSGIWNTITNNIHQAWSAIINFFSGIPKAIESGMGDIVGKIWAALKTSVTWIDTNVLQPIVAFFKALPQRIVTALGDIVGFIWNALKTSVTWVDTNVLQPLIAFFAALPGRIITALGDIVGTIWGALTKTVSWIDTNIITPLITFFGAIPGRIVTVLGDIVGFIWGALTATVAWINTNVIQPVIGVFTKLPGDLKAGLGDIISTVFGVMAGAWDWIDTHVYQPIVSGFTGLPGDIAKAIGSGISAIGAVGKDIINVIIGGIDDAISWYNSHRPSLLGVSLLPALPLIPKLAAGGLVTSPTIALIGEAGPEWVIPVNQVLNTSTMTGHGIIGPSTASNAGGGVTINVQPGAVTVTVPSTTTPGDIETIKQAVNDGFESLGAEVLAGTAPLRG